MQNDVVAHQFRCLDQTPVERNDPPIGTRTPSRALIPHAHPRHIQSVKRRQFTGPRRQLPRGKRSQPTQHRPATGRAVPVQVPGNRNRYSREAQHRTSRAFNHVIPAKLAAKENRGSSGIFRLSALDDRASFDLSLQPGDVLLREPLCFGETASAGNGEPGIARTVQAQPITSRPIVKEAPHGPIDAFELDRSGVARRPFANGALNQLAESRKHRRVLPRERIVRQSCMKLIRSADERRQSFRAFARFAGP